MLIRFFDILFSGLGAIFFRDEENILERAVERGQDRMAFYDQIISPYKGQLEVWYVHHRNLKNYFLVIFITIWVVLFPFPGAARIRAEYLVRRGVGIADAAHLSFAEAAQADFVTCDDRLLRKCRQVKSTVWCGTPIEFCGKEDLK